MVGMGEIPTPTIYKDFMRSKEEIQSDGKRVDLLALEVLLDIRDLLIPKVGKVIPKTGKPRGRPKKK